MTTNAQLKNRLNPTQFNVQIPTDGIFTDNADTGIIYIEKDGRRIAFDPTSLLSDSERRNAGNAGSQRSIGLERLKNNFGIDVKSLPKVNIGDLFTSTKNRTPFESTPDINQFLGIDPAQLTTQTINQPDTFETVDTTELPPNLSQIGTFSRQLQFGDTGEDVKRLQKFLNSAGFVVSKEGAGSPGQETEYFGPKTQKALQEYQKSQGIVTKGDPNSTGFGRLGPQTLASVNKLTVPETPAGTGVPTDNVSTTTQTGATLPNLSTEHDQQLNTLLSNPNLTDDQRELIRRSYDLIATNDIEQANRLFNAFEAATKFSDPFFKAQIAVAKDSLQRGLATTEGDLEFSEQQLSNTLADLREDISASSDFLGLEESQQLENLARSYEVDLENTRQSLAQLGKTSSSVRSRSEQLLAEENQGLVESTRRGFEFQRATNERKQARSERDTQLDIQRLREQAQADKIAQIRRGEELLGTKELQSSGFNDLLGNIGGQIPRQQTAEALGFAQSFVF